MAAALSVRTETNHLHVAGGLSISDFRRVTAALYSLIHDRGYRDVIMDFSMCTFTHAPPMVALICDCMRYRQLGVDFLLVGPSVPELNRLFINSNWASLIDPERFPRSSYVPLKHNPARQFATAEEQGDIVDQVMDTLLANFTGFNRSHLKVIEWSLNEIADNVLVHAQSSVGGIVQVTAMKNKKKVEFVVGDPGIGIATSLKSAYPAISDVDALSRAIREGITRDKKLGQGNGLYGSYRISVTSSGNFSMHANHATLYYTESAGMHSKSEQIPFCGSLVTCGIDYTNDLILEQALQFQDKSHNPTDHIELKYETKDDGNIAFSVASETASVGSRIAGTPIRNKLLNLLRVSEAKQIEVDFSEVPIISSSFADEVFGKMFVEIGPVEFLSKLRFTHVDPTVRKLIDKAIMQRAAVGTDG